MTESLSPAAVVEQVEFVKGICTVPDDDTRRVVYADWLQEHGEPERAEFIRVQVVYDRDFDPSEHAPRGLDLRRRLIELLRHAGSSSYWWADLPGKYRTTDPSVMGITTADGWLYSLRRGFVSAVTCTAAEWLAHADRLYWHPGQKVKCPDCVSGTHGHWETKCDTCEGKAVIDRPFPTDPLPHPITAVRLTTLPVHMSWGLVRLFSNDDGTYRDDRWPSVTFHLPTPA